MSGVELLAPRKYENAREALFGSLEMLHVVINRFRASEVEREATVPEGSLLAEDFTLKGWLFDVSRSGKNAARLEQASERVVATANNIGVYVDSVSPVGVHCARKDHWDFDSWNVLDCIPQGRRIVDSRADACGKLSELSHCYRGLKLADSVVEREEVVVRVYISVPPGLIDKQIHVPRVGRIVGDHQAAFAAGNMLSLLKAEAADVSPGADELSIVGSEEGLGTVFNDRDAVFLCERADCFHLARVTEKVGNYYCFGARADAARDCLRGHVAGLGVYVGKYRNCAWVGT